LVPLHRTCAPDDPGCARPGAPAKYGVTLSKKVLHRAGSNHDYSYFDRAFVFRE